MRLNSLNIKAKKLLDFERLLGRISKYGLLVSLFSISEFRIMDLYPSLKSLLPKIVFVLTSKCKSKPRLSFSLALGFFMI